MEPSCQQMMAQMEQVSVERVGSARANGHAHTDIPAPCAQPTPLIRTLPPAAAYPVDALGPLLGPATHAIAQIAQVPPALAAGSVLATAALAAQAHADVQTLGGARPLSLYVLSIAASGDRKSSSDAIAQAPVREHVRRMMLTYREQMREHELAAAATKDRRQRAKKDAEDSDAYAAALSEIADEPPPRKPWLICSDPTAEGLVRSLADGQYAQAVYTDEGGQFLGGHAMSEDAELRTIALLSRTWGGDPIDRVRATDREHIVLYGRRVSMHLMAQPAVAARMLGSPLYRSQGWLARWLMAAPESLAGTRLHDPDVAAPHDDPRIRRYWHAIAELLARPPIEDHDVGGLNPPCLALAPQARQLLITAYDEMETAQADGAALDGTRDWASKAAEHACRIAGVITLASRPDAVDVSAQAMTGALVLTEHYLSEYGRLIGGAGVPEHIERAQRLLTWLRAQGRGTVTPRDVMRLGPGRDIRSADAARSALRTLAEHGWLTTQDHRMYTVHPSALTKGMS